MQNAYALNRTFMGHAVMITTMIGIQSAIVLIRLQSPVAVVKHSRV